MTKGSGRKGAGPADLPDSYTSTSASLDSRNLDATAVPFHEVGTSMAARAAPLHSPGKAKAVQRSATKPAPKPSAVPQFSEAASPFLPATRPLPVATLNPAAGPPMAHFAAYSRRLSDALATFDWSPVEQLTQDLLHCWHTGRQVFLCGNGGSAGNANHLANDFTFSLSRQKGSGLRVHALSENPAVLTCLANDTGYENIFSYQLAVQARPGDILLAFSGSGNSPNILRALEEARRLGMRSYAVLGFDGGAAKALADVPIHFEIDDMQIAEDTQTVIGHMIVQWLFARRDSAPAR